MDPSVRRLGEFGLLIEHVETGRSAGLAAAIRGALPEVHEVVPGLDSVMVLDPRDDLVARVSAVLERDIPATVTTRHELKIVLDGPDLAEVLAVTGLSRAELETALEATLTVAAIGFSPGFGYLTGLAGPLADLGRRPTPRPRVPAGSLAVAAGMVAIYPHATPGGWWLLGRSSATLFDLDRQVPGLLAAGDEVRLVIVSDDAPGPIPAPRCRLVPPDGVRPVLEVTAVPAGTSLVDDGRRGVAHLGVPTAGAADLERCEVAARLVGGAPGAIEVTGSGLELVVLASTVLAGVDLGLSVDGRSVPEGIPIAVAPGQVVRSTAVGRGARGYLGIAGGPRVPEVLGSISTDSLSGVGPGLAAGDRLGGGPVPTALPVRGAVPDDPSTAVLRVLPGPHAGWLSGSLDGLTARVGATSNRVGMRLVPDEGPIGRRPGEVMSMATVLGAIQLPPDGCPIILGPDRATLGGYPIVGVVAAADHGVLGRLAPGDPVVLVDVDAGQAEAALEDRTRLRAGFVAGSAPTLR